jgi:hypothetical protein
VRPARPYEFEPTEEATMRSRPLIVASLATIPALVLAAQRSAGVNDLPLSDPSRLTLVNTVATRAHYRGRDAIRLIAQRDSSNAPGPLNTIAILGGPEFRDGTIEADVAGVPAAGSDTSARGFVGIAFRVDSSGDRYAGFYLRPTNGRASDQLRRNHAVQYISEPDYPWYRLRKEQPGVYESYVDLEPGVWTSIRIEVREGVAQLFVNGSKQPVLIVSDMKSPPSVGRIALWIDADTEAHFARVHVTPSKRVSSLSLR